MDHDWTWGEARSETGISLRFEYCARCVMVKPAPTPEHYCDMRTPDEIMRDTVCYGPPQEKATARIYLRREPVPTDVAASAPPERPEPTP